METIYDVNYFIAKFEAIPEKEIGYSQDTGCAYGQCSPNRMRGHLTQEGIALTNLMQSIKGLTPIINATWTPYESTPARINNGDVAQYQQPTPKQRILAALYDIKAMQQPKEKVVYKTVVIDSAVKELQETLNEN